MDAALRSARAERRGWNRIAAEMRVARTTVMDRAKFLGMPMRLPRPAAVALSRADDAAAPLPRLDRSDRRTALRPGSPESWGVLAALTPSIDAVWPG